VNFIEEYYGDSCKRDKIDGKPSSGELLWSNQELSEDAEGE
jgi:hypothetical protein